MKGYYFFSHPRIGIDVAHVHPSPGVEALLYRRVGACVVVLL